MTTTTKIYSDNPFIDELVYYVKQLAINCVIKNSQDANLAETITSIKASDIYMSCVEGRAIFELLNFPEEILKKLKLEGTDLEDCLKNKYNIPDNLRSAAVSLMMPYYVNNYIEENEYYRILIGLPPIGFDGVCIEASDVPSDLILDITTPVHLYSKNELAILEREGIIDDLIARYPEYRYLYYITKDISIYDARNAENFQIIYMPTIESDIIQDKFKYKYGINRTFTMKTIYSEAFKFDSTHYDNVMIIFIILQTMVDIISEIQENITRRDVFDNRCINYIFESYGVPYYSEIPIKYQIKMMKNLNTLLKYKSTYKCMIDICSLFGFDDIQVFKYFLLRDRKLDENGEYQFNYKNEITTIPGETIINSDDIVIIQDTLTDITIPFPFEDFIEKGNVLRVKLNGLLLINGLEYEVTSNILNITDTSKLTPNSSIEFLFYYNESSVNAAPIQDLDDYVIHIVTKKYTITESDQVRFPIELEYENYLTSPGTIRIVVGSLWVNPSRYTITEDGFVTFNEPQDWATIGKEITYMFIYNTKLQFHAEVSTVTVGSLSTSNIAVPEPIDKYCDKGNTFFIDIAGTYISKDRYGVTSNSAVFLDNSDRVANGRDVTFNMYYTDFENVELTVSELDIIATEPDQIVFPITLPIDTYMDNGYKVYVKYAGTSLASYQFDILKNSLTLLDTSMGVMVGDKINLKFIYPTTIEKDLLDIKYVTATIDLQQQFEIPFPFDKFMVRNNYFYVSVDGIILDPSRYEIDGNTLNIYTIKNAITKGKNLIFFFYYREANKDGVQIEQFSSIATTDGQKTFAIEFPFFDYLYAGNGLFVTVGSVLLDESRYTIVNETLTILDDTYIEEGRAIIVTFIFHSIYKRYDKYINATSKTYALANAGEDYSILIPYPFDNFMQSGNSMIISINGNIISPIEYDIVDGYLVLADIERMREYGPSIRFDFTYNLAKEDITITDDNDKNYELKFVKVPLSDNADTYMKNGNNHMDYDSVTITDPLWDGEYDHEQIKSAILNKEFAYTRTKFISIDSVCEMTSLAFDISYFFNILFDDVYLEEKLTLALPSLRENKNFKLNDVFVYLTAITYIYDSLNDDIMDTTGKILYIKGFNFRADIAALKDYIEREGFTYEDLGISGFEIPKTNLLTYSQLLNIFTTNKNIYNHVVSQLNNAGNKRIYSIYKKIFDSLMIKNFNNKFFQIQDGSGIISATYTDYLHYRDKDLYNSLVYAKSLSDVDQKQSYILEMVSSVVYELDAYIDTEEYKNIYSRLPGISTDYLKKYIEKVINFFKSYKVELFGISTIYKFSSKMDNTIRAIDEIIMTSKFTREENSIVKDSVQCFGSLSKNEQYLILDKLYLDVSRWVMNNNSDNIGTIDSLFGLTCTVLFKTTLSDNIRESIANYIITKSLDYNINLLQSVDLESRLMPIVMGSPIDKAYISYY